MDASCIFGIIYILLLYFVVGMFSSMITKPLSSQITFLSILSSENLIVYLHTYIWIYYYKINSMLTMKFFSLVFLMKVHLAVSTNVKLYCDTPGVCLVHSYFNPFNFYLSICLNNFLLQRLFIFAFYSHKLWVERRLKLWHYVGNFAKKPKIANGCPFL